MLKAEQIAAIEAQLHRIERRQRRIELAVVLVLLSALIALLSDGDRTAFTVVVVLAVALCFVAVVRSVIDAGRGTDGSRPG
jgi:uncharacterized membrane protein HdeD (DUF308 family)